MQRNMLSGIPLPDVQTPPPPAQAGPTLLELLEGVVAEIQDCTSAITQHETRINHLTPVYHDIVRYVNNPQGPIPASAQELLKAINASLLGVDFQGAQQASTDTTETKQAQQFAAQPNNLSQMSIPQPESAPGYEGYQQATFREKPEEIDWEQRLAQNQQKGQVLGAEPLPQSVSGLAPMDGLTRQDLIEAGRILDGLGGANYEEQARAIPVENNHTRQISQVGLGNLQQTNKQQQELLKRPSPWLNGA
jgi:hypothetical protein